MKAHELIQRPENWTQHEYARNIDDEPVKPQSADATCFCVIGAIKLAYSFNKAIEPIRDKLLEHINVNRPEDKKTSIVIWNDTHTHEVVYDTLKLLDI